MEPTTTETVSAPAAVPALDIGQLLDVLIARLSALADEKAAKRAASSDATPVPVEPEPVRRFEIPFVPVPTRRSP